MGPMVCLCHAPRGGSDSTRVLCVRNRVCLVRACMRCRKRLAKAIPGLRPWEVLEVEQVFNYLTFRDDFWRPPLGNYTTPLGYRDDLKETEAEEWGDIKDALDTVFPELNQY